MTWVTCHTVGCVNEDVPIEANLTDEEGQAIDIVICGPCDQPISDRQETYPATTDGT